MVHIVDLTGKFSEAKQNELTNFVTRLLHNMELEWLTIKIRRDAYTDYDGYWKAEFKYNNQNEIKEVRAVIVLNNFYLKTLDELKKHWHMNTVITGLYHGLLSHKISIIKNNRYRKITISYAI